MNLPSLFDKYERNARLYPALLVTSPLIVAAGTTTTVFERGFVPHIIAGIILVAAFYAMMSAVRQLGRRVEPELWNNWGGPPSTRFMRWSDNTFSDEWKKVAHKAVANSLGISLSALSEKTCGN